jgi:tyrosyl-tRNA synthetase
MRFSIAPQIFEQFPDYCVGGVVATGINNRSADRQRIYNELQDQAMLLRRRFATGETAPGGSNPITGNPAIAAWREAFRKAGIKPSEFLSSVEALARRASKNGSLPAINPTVDVYNAISLKYMLPIGSHDLDAVVGDLEVRYARQGEFFSPMDSPDGQVETVPAGEPVYADEAEVRTRRWVWREGRKTMVKEDSHNVFFPIDGWIGLNEAQVRQAAHELKARLSEWLGAECQEFFLDAAHPSLEILPGKKMSGPTIITNLKRERDLVDELLTRGVAGIYPSPEELEAKLRSGKQLRVKLGIDPTGPQIHIGRSVAINKLYDFQRLGHKVVMLFGTFTGQIGDVSGHTTARPMLTPDQVEQNVTTYKEQVSLILNADEVEWRFNTEWFADMPFKEGIVLMSHFTVAQMLERDTFRQRFDVGKPISLQEIVYPVLQGYDSVMLKADVEIGGTDQLFNMMAGRHIQKIYGQPEQSVLTNKMINAPDGQKMSTSLGNGVYITEPPQDLYAKMLRTLDEMIPEYFEVLTRVPLSEIEEMQAAMAKGESPLKFKKRLAFTMVEKYRGKPAAEEAAEAFERQFVNKELPEDIPEYTPPAGTTELALRDLLVETKLAASKKEADRYVEQNGISINGEKATDSKAKIQLQDGMLVKRGARHFVRIKI